MRLAAATAKMGFIFTRRGISPDGCSSWLLPRLVGMTCAQDWMISGRVFSDSEALSAGLLAAVIEPEALLTEARRLALVLVADTSPVAVAVTRRLLWDMLTAPHPRAAHLAESRALARLGSADDATEGVRSFLE